MRVGIVAQRDNERARALGLEIADALDSAVSVRVDEQTAIDAETTITGVPVAEMTGDAFVVSIGGDGTFLFVARQVGSTPVMGVNLGEVGFLNAVAPADAVERVRAEVEQVRATGDPRFREVPRIEVTRGPVTLPPALNEIVVQGRHRGPAAGVDVELGIDGSTYLDTRADGVVVATQTGSTAYNLSEGGPILHPSATELVVTPMCPTEQVPPLVVGGDRTVELRVRGADSGVVASDGTDRCEIELPATVGIASASEPARIAGPRSDFFEALEKIG